MPTPLPHQLEGASFLAKNRAALLADAPRVGKTGASIMACDLELCRKILVVTKASARADWGYQIKSWQSLPRTIQVIYSKSEKVDPNVEVVVVAWSMVYDKKIREQLALHDWDAIILDESHEAKNPDAQRTSAVYNAKDGLYRRGARVWCLSGTPIPNAPCDLFPMLQALAPERLGPYRTYDSFMRRYCVVRKKYVGGRWIEYPIKGQNEEELRKRLEGFWLRRTQQDVGITAPIYSVFALHGECKGLTSLDGKAAIAALEAEEASEAHLAVIRRLTGEVKAKAVIEAIKERLEDDLDKVVLMAWHTDVIDMLKDGLKQFGVVGIDGRTNPHDRQEQVENFRGEARVFVGQVLAAGEAIDLSSAAELWFVEPSFTPKDMAQAAMRICNHTQKRQPLVRFCALDNSIDEAFMEILARKVKSIKLTMEK